MRELPSPVGRAAYLCYPDETALVLGSSQSDALVEVSGARNHRVVRRRSGGGAVLVAPGAQVWLDVFIARDDPLFDEDVGRGAHVVGELWRNALGEALGAAGLEVHRGPNIATSLSRTACFAGLGPGEVRLGGRKVVGLSQRRDRRGAWFFSMVMVRRDHLELVRMLHLASDVQVGLERVLEEEVLICEDASAIERALRAELARESRRPTGHAANRDPANSPP